MGDALVFIAILFVFYLGECVYRFPRTHYLLQLSPWWTPNPGRASEYFGTDTWGLFLVNPLPPLTIVFLAPEWPDSKHKTSLDEALNDKRLNHVLDNFRNATHWLRMLGNGMFWYIFLVVPSVLYLLGGMFLLPAIVGLLVFFIIPSGVFFYRAHRRLIDKGTEDLFSVMISILLFPPATIRACDRLSLSLLKGFHPLLLAHRFSIPKQFRRFAGAYLRNVKYPLHEASTPEEDRQEAVTVLKAVEKFLQKHDMSLEEFLDPGSPLNEESMAYCPRCLEEYLRSDGTCSDCPGVRLQPLS